jgi:hypothetical protein
MFYDIYLYTLCYYICCLLWRMYEMHPALFLKTGCYKSCAVFCLFSVNHPFHLKTNSDTYNRYVPMAYDDYLEEVAWLVPHRAKQIL